MARGDDGRWSLLQAGPSIGRDDVLAMVDDLDPLLDLGLPAPVVGLRPQLPGSPDAVATTTAGEVVLIYVDEPEVSEPLSERLAAHVQGRAPSLVGRLDRLRPDDTIGTYVSRWAGIEDATRIDAAVAEALACGGIIHLVLCLGGHECVAASVLELEQRSGLEIYCVDVETWRAGAAVVACFHPVTPPQLLASARTVRTKAERAQLVQSFEGNHGVEASRRLRALLSHVDSFYDVTHHVLTDSRISVRAWLVHGSGTPDLELHDDGVVIVRLPSLNEGDERFLARRLERVLDADHRDFLRDRVLRVSLTEQLVDLSLVEQFIGLVADELLCWQGAAMVNARRDAAA